MTYPLEGGCSIQLSYESIKCLRKVTILAKFVH